ncbi:adenine deaminase C-terminal domain-containing protein [Ornithinibacillus californiensis]|uniref:adenine deaminase C-terminal domain-containing protein n=1 Tax=Ornithinibacillus californiensis TaxID=161536 RepID=UPI00064DEEEF|nr:adenine deaminase C-terminal domain-containing protein [Ornithinibacillus californiensis]
MNVDLLIRQANVFNTFLKQFEVKDIGIVDGKFFFANTMDWSTVNIKESMDGSGKYIIPGLIDIHMHIESSMVPPSIFSKAALTHGVTTVVADAHEIVNVFGLEGMKEFFKEDTEMDIFYAIPSSVPSTTTELETTGGVIGLDEVRALLEHPRVIALGEAMNFKGIVHEPDSLIRNILRETQIKRPFLPIEGHVPDVTGEDLARFLFAGITADHTQQTPASIYEKISNGIFVELQKKSITKENIDVINDHQLYEYTAIITDDIMADDLIEGHLNANVKLAIACGLPVEQAIYMATYTPARRMGFQDRGAIVSGFQADFIMLDELEAFTIDSVYKAGKKVHQKGEPIGYPEQKPSFPSHFYQSVQGKAWKREDLQIAVSGEKAICNVIQKSDVGTFTKWVQREVAVKDGYLDWEASGLSLLVVMERYGKNGNQAFALVENGLKDKGAIGTTWAHDHHNLMVMGTSAEDMIVAQQELLREHGGYVVVQDQRIIANCALPIGGILSDAPIQELGRDLQTVRQAMVDLGYVNTNEIMSFSTLSLPVSPAIKITDRGMLDVRTHEIIPFIEKVIQ